MSYPEARVRMADAASEEALALAVVAVAVTVVVERQHLPGYRLRLTLRTACSQSL